MSLSGGYGEAVQRVWECCMDSVGRPYGGCAEVVWREWGGCLDGVGRLY